jgi:tetraacyldisaccharide 4'-kinase
MAVKGPVTALQRIRNQIETLMQGPGETGLLSPAMLLRLLAGGYGAAVRLRASFYQRGLWTSQRLPCKVISVGNLTVGGTGKTPMTRYLARLVQSLGREVAIVSRGYKGRAEKSGGIVSDGKRILMDADTAGDEPFMLASELADIPVAVGRNRFAVAQRLLEAYNPEVIILDDAFQHLSLARDLNVVLLDHHRPFGNYHLLPRGTLREPLTALARGDVYILTRSNRPGGPDWRQLVKRLPARPVLRASTRLIIDKVVGVRDRSDPESARSPKRQAIEYLHDRRVFLFSGLADNREFKRTIEEAGPVIVGMLSYSDHYSYSDQELGRIAAAAVAHEAELIVTTAKDCARIAPQTQWPLDLCAVDVEMELPRDREALVQIIHDCLDPGSAKAGAITS